MANLRAVRKLALQHGIPVVIDCSLISENAYFIKRREADYANCSVRQIVREMMTCADLIYLSGRKSTCVRGGLIATSNAKYFESLKAWLPVYEGFIRVAVLYRSAQGPQRLGNPVGGGLPGRFRRRRLRVRPFCRKE